MKTVYWSPWAPPDIYTDEFITHSTPTRLIDEVTPMMDKTNGHDNFLHCQAVQSMIKNTYVIKNPFEIHIDFSTGTPVDKVVRHRHDHSYKFLIKGPSLKDSLTINYFMNWIFYSEEPLTIQTMPAYFHNSSILKTGFYVPGSYDISNWFRPVEGAFQLYKGETTFKCKEDEPLYYVKFLTDEPIQLKKFYLSKELHDMGMSCIRAKTFRGGRPLQCMYNLFKGSKADKRILKEIKKNLIDD
jgi:hypothetical protein